MKIRNALILGGMLVALSQGLEFLNRLDVIGVDIVQRIRGMASGGVLVYFANLVPKILEPMLGARCGPDNVQALQNLQALQRFAGWTLVLAGLGYSLAWLVLPIEHARTPSMVLVAACLLLVVARVLWFIIALRRAQPPAEL